MMHETADEKKSRVRVAVGILNHLTNSQITLAVVLAYMTLQLSQFIFLYKKN